MQAIVFDGRAFAKEKEKDLRFKIADRVTAFRLRKRGIIPKLASILVGDNAASELYLNLKKKAAERIGSVVEIHNFSENVKPGEVMSLIKKLNLDNSTHGIMIQLPLPRSLFLEAKRLIDAIDPEKDVDGMRDDSPFVAPVVKAVIEIVRQSELRFKIDDLRKIVVVGSEGFVGRKLIKELRVNGFRVKGYDIETSNLKHHTVNADILISATGIPDLIRGEMVKDGAVVIDVGSPKGDVNFAEVSQKASFITPVPGGVGPVTISCLLENLFSASPKKSDDQDFKKLGFRVYP